MKIFGLWTEEEFRDVLILASVVGIVSFTTTIIYRAVSKWLEEHDKRGSS